MTGDDTVADERVAIDDIDREVAAAFGLYALSDASLYEAADAAGVSRWALEDEIERAGLSETFGLDEDRDVSSTIDSLLERGEE